MPVPVSDTAIITYWPGSDFLMLRDVGLVEIGSCAVSIVSLPPSGIASRAFTARLSSALSSWFGSVMVRHRPPASTVSIAIASPSVRRSSSDMPATSWLASTGRGSSAWRRANASSRWVSVAARCAPCVDHAQRAADARLVGAERLRQQTARSVSAPPMIDGQQVVEVVRDAAGELADRFHLLRLAQRFLGAHALGDLLGDPLLQRFVERSQALLCLPAGAIQACVVDADRRLRGDPADDQFIALSEDVGAGMAEEQSAQHLPRARHHGTAR